MYRKIEKQKYNFTAKPLDSEILLNCKISGMISTMHCANMAGMLLECNHPIADSSNALKVIGEIAKQKSHNKVESQLLAGCILSLLSSKGKTTNFPNSSATEANMLLQSAGNENLWNLAEIIMLRWNNDATWIRVPKFSFDLTAYSFPHQNMTAIVSRYAKFIRKALSLDELPAAETAEIYKAFKENSIKNNKNKMDTVTLEQAINRTITQLQDDSLEKQKNTAKGIIKFLKDGDKLPRNITLQCEKILANLWMISNSKRVELAMQIRLLAQGTSHSGKAESLAWIIENAKDHNADTDLLGAMETVLPTKSTPKTLAEIFAEKGIKS